MNFLKTITLLTSTAFILLLVALAIKGNNAGNVDFQDPLSRDKRIGGPFETTGSTSRYVLTEAIVEDNTFFLNEERAKFASPDVSEYKGKYFSIFTPGVSFLGVPFYLLGKTLGVPQIATYALTALLAVGNLALIAIIARRLGVGFYASLLSGMLFLFGTNALSYSPTFTQHHASTFVILLGTLSALGKRNFLNNIWFGVLYGVGLLIDIPNGIIMLPLVFYILYKQLDVRSFKKELKFSLKLNFVGLLIGFLPLLGIFGWYNYQLTGSYLSLPQFIGRTDDFSEQQTEVSEFSGEQLGFNLPFNTRNQLQGLYTFFLSDERGFPVYQPILLLGIVGLYLVHRKKKLSDESLVVSTLILVNLITYTLFKDPTGSWSFGPRYLIPGAALLSAGIGVALDKYRKRALFIVIFLLLSVYSVGVNVLGTMTTTMVPPKVEAVNLPNPIPYTYEYNWQLMVEEGLNSSLFYNLYLSDFLSSTEFSLMYAFMALGLISFLYYVVTLDKGD